MQPDSDGAFDELARALLDSPADAIVATDRDGKITFWNPGAERVLGFSSADAVGESLDIIIPERLREAHWQGFSEVVRTGESRYGAGDTLSVPGLRKDGERISLDFTIVMLTGPDGAVTGMAAVLRDVTERFEELKGLRRRVRELEKPAD